MKLGEYSINHLAKAVCGDSSYTPYVKGYELVLMFNKYGFSDVYEQGFPSRWKYTEDKLRELNGSDNIRKIIEEVVDPRRFHGLEIKIENAVAQINEFLKYEKYELKKSGEFYKIFDFKGTLVEPETTKGVDHKFIQEQIEKCNKKITESDFSGAITNARTLIEAIFIEIIEKSENSEIKNDGNIDNLWKKVKKILRLEIDKDSLPDTIIQILSGIDSVVKGLAGLSNDSADRHANKFQTKKHHAKLAVNAAMTISDFLLDSYQYQKK
jgi:hypothetical protein